MSTALVIYGAALVILTVSSASGSRKRHAPRTSPTAAAADTHALSAPTIDYTRNPNRIGAYVYVMESDSPSDLDWAGTFLGMSNGMALVRDRDSHIVAHVNRDQLYSAQR